MKEKIEQFTCGECGAQFEAPEGGVCNRCSRLLCGVHSKDAFAKVATGKTSDWPLWNACLSNQENTVKPEHVNKR